jgi:pimeloyl-ACP methyl ester carboxylesterase
MVTQSPEYILFAQHGWADDHRSISSLASGLASGSEQTITVIAPNLGYLKTWLRIEPLIQAVEQVAASTLETMPTVPWRIIGHSMGGLIWLEVLQRHPDWWQQVESLVLIASPVGGADLGLIFDPFEWGIGIARDLSRNRRPIAEAIAAVIPTLVIAGDVDAGSDGTITLGSTRFAHAGFVCLPGLAHAALRNHPEVTQEIRKFWTQTDRTPASPSQTEIDLLIRRLQAVPGMMDAHPRDFQRSRTILTLPNGTTIRTWRSPLGVDHVFVGCASGRCLYSGFVGWQHAEELRQALQTLQREHNPFFQRCEVQ